MLLGLIALLFPPAPAQADEGMWLPEQIPEIAEPWQERGLQIPPEQLADPLGEPLGAIVSLGFCSASFVSEDGLMLTNHHCVEGFLQQNSTGERNLHRDGYVARTRADELPVGPGGKVTVVESIEDVTEQVLSRVGRRTRDLKRYERISEAKKRLVADCERERARRCRVATYRGGAEFRLIQAIELADVRIVAAPPMAVGQFGGEIDNWMWPRHGADFAVLRAYVAPDGSVAEHSDDNVPYKPPHHLEIDVTGAEPGSFVMVAGYPGRTARHRRTASLAWYAQSYLPRRQELIQDVHDILVSHAESDEDARARLGASISRLANGLKNGQGLLDGLSHGDLVAEKEQTEAALLAWIDADPGRTRRWRADIDAHLELIHATQQDRDREFYASWASRGADLLGIARTAVRWAQEREKKHDIERDAGLQDRDRDRIEARFRRLERSLHLASDREVLERILTAYQQAPAESRIAQLDGWIEAQGGLQPALDRLYESPALADTQARLDLLDQDLDTLQDTQDPWVELALVFESWAGPRREISEERSGARLRLEPAWYAALEAWHAEQGETLYDDANGTLRLTLGTVEGYEPQDGLIAVPQTTARGFAAKAGEAPFDAPAHLVDAARDASQHRLADKALGDVPADFLTTLDSTGGNSGSAVLDGQGRLVGLLFDGNYESIASDWVFLDGLTRSICVDIRWVGFVLDHMEGAERVLDELRLSE